MNGDYEVTPELVEVRGHQPRWCPMEDLDQEIARRERHVNV
jgi:hypothetical protein